MPSRRLPPARATLTSLLSVLGTACLATACASGAGPSGELEGAVPQTMRVTTPSGVQNVDMVRSIRSELAEVPAAPAAVFRVLPAAFTAVGMEPTAMVAAERRVALVDGRFRRRLGKERLSRYVSCGTGMTGAPNADEYEVRLTVNSRVAPAAGDTARSALATLVTAYARPATGSTDPITCSSTGALESQLAAEARRLVAAR
jgi:hypothetical protein